MASYSVSLQVDHSVHEVIVAELDDLGAEGFEEKDELLVVFFSARDWEEREDQIRFSIAEYDCRVIGEPIFLDDRNWNADWEATIQPIDVDPFWIRASWNTGSAPEGRTIIIIDPKMSFGTGYHETTRLMLRTLSRYVSGGERVLDAGTGTGVLGIAALLRGASSCLGFDIDEWSADNANENAERNGVANRFEVREGDESVVPERNFDVILANINRNALIGMLSGLLLRLSKRGVLGLSGLLLTDRPGMMDSLKAHPVDVLEESEEGEWWSVWVQHATGND